MFKFTLEGDIEARFAEIKRQAVSRGIKVNGTSKWGTLEGQLGSAEYEINGNELTVTVTDAPRWLPDSMIRSELEKFIQE